VLGNLRHFVSSVFGQITGHMGPIGYWYKFSV